MSDEPEEWRAVVGWEGLYEVSSLGRVRSLDRIVDAANAHAKFQRLIKGKLLNPSPRPKKPPFYLVVTLKTPGRAACPTVHTLVCTAFHGPRPQDQQACHNNGQSHDNREANLRWGTAFANARDREGHGRTHHGVGHHSARLKPADVREIRKRVGEVPQHVGDEYGVSRTAIIRIWTRRTWRRVE